MGSSTATLKTLGVLSYIAPAAVYVVADCHLWIRFAVLEACCFASGFDCGGSVPGLGGVFAGGNGDPACGGQKHCRMHSARGAALRQQSNAPNYEPGNALLSRLWQLFNAAMGAISSVKPAP